MPPPNPVGEAPANTLKPGLPPVDSSHVPSLFARMR